MLTHNVGLLSKSNSFGHIYSNYVYSNTCMPCIFQHMYIEYIHMFYIHMLYIEYILIPTYVGIYMAYIIYTYSNILYIEYILIPTYVCYVYSNVLCTSVDVFLYVSVHVGWLRLVSSLKLLVSFAEYRLFSRDLLQKRPVILRSLLNVATP